MAVATCAVAACDVATGAAAIETVFILNMMMFELLCCRIAIGMYTRAAADAVVTVDVLSLLQ